MSERIAKNFLLEILIWHMADWYLRHMTYPWALSDMRLLRAIENIATQR